MELDEDPEVGHVNPPLCQATSITDTSVSTETIVVHQAQDIAVTYCYANPRRFDSADENALRKGKHREVCLMQL